MHKSNNMKYSLKNIIPETSQIPIHFPTDKSVRNNFDNIPKI